jgi:hypothetical protein
MSCPLLCEAERVDDIRPVLRGLLLRGQHKLHWRDEQVKRRRVIAETIGTLPVEALVVVRACRADERLERRRRGCLERLCWELERLGVVRMVLESRGRADDLRDRGMLDALRARKTVTGKLRMDHVAGRADEMLWLPDAVCGAVVASRVGEPVYLETLSDRITVTTVTWSG